MQTSDLWNILFLAWAVVFFAWLAFTRPAPQTNAKRGNVERLQGDAIRRYLLAFNAPKIYVRKL